MKTVFASLIVILTVITCFSQGDIRYSIAVASKENKPVANLMISAMETTTLKRVNVKTAPDGKATLQLNAGKDWAITIGEMKNHFHLFSMPGRMVASSRFFVYDVKDYKRKQRQNPARTDHDFKIIPQAVKENTPFKSTECLLTVSVRHPQGQVLSGLAVSVVNIKDSIIYTGRTNAEGRAFFIVPNKRDYDIDIDGLKNYHYADFGDEHTFQNVTVFYAPTVVKETIHRDTVFQELDEHAKPSSERTLMKIAVDGGKKNGISERVYLRQIHTGKVYTTVTDDFGNAYFLIPFKHIYLIDFKHQKNVDAINLSHVNEITTGQMKAHYTPDPRLEYPETFIPTPDRLILKDFNDFLEKQFSKPTNKPFALVFRNARRINKNSREALFSLTLSGAVPQGNVRMPLNAALVLDKSGSMYSNGRSDALKNSLLEISSTLSDKDVVSVILFDDHAWEVQHTTNHHAENLKTIAENYAPSGSTNILEGLARGAESLQNNYDVSKSNKIILLTDGYGDNPPEEVTKFVEDQFANGIEFSTIGLGDDCNQSLLELVASKGNGTYSYVDQSAMLSDAFLKEMKSSLSYGASDVKVEIFHNEKLIFSSLHGYPVKGQENDKIIFEIAKVPYGTNRLAFLKFKLNNPSPAIEASPLTVKVTYFDLLKKQTVSYEERIKLEWTNETNTGLLLDQREKMLYGIAILNQSLKLMSEAHVHGDQAAAKEALKDGMRQTDEIFPEAKPKEIRALFEEAAKYLRLFEQMQKNAH